MCVCVCVCVCVFLYYNYQVSEMVVREIEFADIACHANINSDKYSNTDWQFEMFKRGKDNGRGTGFKCKLKTGFLI